LDSDPRGGFTLIELSVLVVIMILVTAVSLPSLSGTVRTLSLKTSAREIASTCRLARNLAISSKNEYRVIFDFENQAYKIDGPEMRKDLGNQRNIAEGLYFSRDCGTEENQDSMTSELSLVFFAGGYTSGGCINISSNSAYIVLQLDPVTGRIVCGRITELPE